MAAEHLICCTGGACKACHDYKFQAIKNSESEFRSALQFEWTTVENTACLQGAPEHCALIVGKGGCASAAWREQRREALGPLVCLLHGPSSS